MRPKYRMEEVMPGQQWDERLVVSKRRVKNVTTGDEGVISAADFEENWIEIVVTVRLSSQDFLEEFEDVI